LSEVVFRRPVADLEDQRRLPGVHTHRDAPQYVDFPLGQMISLAGSDHLDGAKNFVHESLRRHAHPRAGGDAPYQLN
jgi:hypothetical protein